LPPGSRDPRRPAATRPLAQASAVRALARASPAVAARGGRSRRAGPRIRDAARVAEGAGRAVDDAGAVTPLLDGVAQHLVGLLVGALPHHHVADRPLRRHAAPED